MSWVTVKTFQFAHEAAVPASKLESEGISCNVEDTSASFTINISSDVRLMVHENDAELAFKFLLEWGYLKASEYPDVKHSNYKKYPKWLFYIILIICLVLGVLAALAASGVLSHSTSR